MIIIDNKRYAKTKHPTMEEKIQETKEDAIIPTDTIEEISEPETVTEDIPELGKIVIEGVKDPSGTDIKEFNGIAEENTADSNPVKEDYTTPTTKVPGSKDEFGRVYVYSVESELHELFTKHYTVNIGCVYDIISKINDKQYQEFRKILKLPERRIIDDTVFIKSFEIEYNNTTDVNAVFYIILDSKGRPVPSYNNQYVKIHPSYGIISGAFKNYIITKENLDLRYVVGMSDSDLGYDIIGTNEVNSYGYDAQYNLPILSHINKLYTYDNKYVPGEGTQNPFLYIKSVEGTEVKISTDKTDYIKMRDEREREFKRQADMLKNANKYGTRKYNTNSFSSKSKQHFIEESMIDSIIDVYALAQGFDWSSLFKKDNLGEISGNKYHLGMEEEEVYIAKAKQAKMQNYDTPINKDDLYTDTLQESNTSFKSRKRLF